MLFKLNDTDYSRHVVADYSVKLERRGASDISTVAGTIRPLSNGKQYSASVNLRRLSASQMESICDLSERSDVTATFRYGSRTLTKPVLFSSCDATMEFYDDSGGEWAMKVEVYTID